MHPDSFSIITQKQLPIPRPWQEKAQTLEGPPCGKCRLRAKGTRDVATDLEPVMLLVWFPELGSKMPGSQAGNLCQAKQAISTHRNPAAQQLLKAMKLQACWFPGQRAGEPGACESLSWGDTPHRSQGL